MRASSFFFVALLRRGLGGERLLVQAHDVAQAVGLHVERLEAGARLLVARLELEHVLEELDDLLVGPRLVGEHFRRLPEERPLLGRAAGAARRPRRRPRACATWRRLLEKLLDLREGGRVPRREGERPFEVGHRAELVAEDVAEEARRLVEELRRDRRRRRP